MGEMERDALIAHGAADVLQERFCLSSDAYKIPVCRPCGQIVTSKDLAKPHVCRSCGGNDFGTCTVPYPLHALNLLLGGANMSMKLDLKNKDEAEP